MNNAARYRSLILNVSAKRLTMQKKIIYLQSNGEEFNLQLRRSKRAKNIILKVNMSGEAEVVVPWYVSFSAAERFVKRNTQWLQENIEKNKAKKKSIPKRDFSTGTLLPVLGDVRQLVVKVEPKRSRSRFKEAGDTIEVVVARNSDVQVVLEKWYRAKAQQYYDRRVAHYTEIVGVQVNKIVVSGARTQWGSCMRNKCRISLQWRLAQAPLYIVDYVIAHEVMHLKVRGHNKEFWHGVEGICPEYKQYRKWLRENGQTLYW